MQRTAIRCSLQLSTGDLVNVTAQSDEFETTGRSLQMSGRLPNSDISKNSIGAHLDVNHLYSEWEVCSDGPVGGFLAMDTSSKSDSKDVTDTVNIPGTPSTTSSLLQYE